MRALNNTASRFNLNLIAGLTLIISLAACGGGNSSSSSGNGITLPTAPVTITPTNAPQVAGAAVDAAFGGTSLPTGVQTSAPAPSAVATVQKVSRIGHGAVQRIVTQSTTPATVTGVVQSFPCTLNGTVSFDTAATTSVTMTFNNCSDFAGETINGTLSMSGYSSTPPTEAFDVVYNLTIATTSPANTLTAKGDMHLVINLTTGAMTMSGASLSMGNTDATLGNFGLQNYTIAFDATGNVTTMTFTFASTAINGTAIFDMTTPFVFGAGMFPSSGAATITGANSTKLKLTVLGDESAPVGSQVKLELSTDNGATYASPTYVTWASISSNL